MIATADIARPVFVTRGTALVIAATTVPALIQGCSGLSSARALGLGVVTAIAFIIASVGLGWAERKQGLHLLRTASRRSQEPH